MIEVPNLYYCNIVEVGLTKLYTTLSCHRELSVSFGAQLLFSWTIHGFWEAVQSDVIILRSCRTAYVLTYQLSDESSLIIPNGSQ